MKDGGKRFLFLKGNVMYMASKRKQAVTSKKEKEEDSSSADTRKRLRDGDTNNDRDGNDEAEELRCPICLSIFVDAVQSPCCGQNTCRPCMMALDASKRCPFCRCKDFDPARCVPDIKMERRAATAKLPCTNKGKGCPFVGNRAARAAHEEDDCDFVNWRDVAKDLKAKLRTCMAEQQEAAATADDLKQQVAKLSNFLKRAKSRQTSAEESMIELLKQIHGVAVVASQEVHCAETANGTYSIAWSTNQHTKEFDAYFTVGNFNVSYFARCTTHPNETISGVRILHPSDPRKDYHVESVLCPKTKEYRGYRNTMTSDNFLEFVCNNKIFLAV